VAAPDLNDADYSALAEFRHRLRVFLAFSEAQARGAGLNPQQHQLLLAVRGFGGDGPSVGALAERLLLRHHSVVELIDRLEKRGLVERRRGASDRRVAHVSITREGARLLRELSVAHRAELRRAAPELARALASFARPVRATRPSRARKTKP
jgi:DNA-binding MarR family transcriptional regulator